MKSGIRQLMINEWKMVDTDWMGYKLQRGEIFTYHHLIVPKRFGGQETIDNGAILCGKTAHPYLHVIEAKDYDMFQYITNLLININNQREMPSRQQLLAIDAILRQFEREHCGETTRKGKQLIKTEYVERRGPFI